MRARPMSLLPAARLIAIAAVSLGALAIGAIGSPGTARAGDGAENAEGDADEAELHFQLGATCYKDHDYTCALEHFLLSNRLAPNRNVRYDIARTYEQLGRFADAHRYYRDALDDETDPQVLDEILSALARITPKVAVLAVETTPPGATLYLDRKDLGKRGLSPRLLAVPEGRYVVIATLDGHREVHSHPIEAKLGTTAKLHLDLPLIVGGLTIASPPGAWVKADDDHGPVGCIAPCTLQLPPGPHVVYVGRDGHQTVSRRLTIKKGEDLVIRPNLVTQTGSLLVTADEPGALVELDGQAAGFTPALIPTVPVGRHRVRVTLRGFKVHEQDVLVEPGRQAAIGGVMMVPVREVSAASRHSERIDEAPASVTVLTGEELRAFAYPTIAEALRGVRGISLSDDSMYSSINVRGIGQPNDYGNKLLVLSDGAVLNDNILSSSYVGFDGRTDLEDVERIEVVRGAGSVLYGTGALSGVINLVTRDRDAPASVHASIGTAEDGVTRVRAGFQQHFAEDTGMWASVALGRAEGRTLTFDAIPGTRTGSTTSHVGEFRSLTTAGRLWRGPFDLQWFLTTREQRSTIGIYSTAFGDPTTRQTDTRALLEGRYEAQLSPLVQLMVRAHGNLYEFRGTFVGPGETTRERYEGIWAGTEARLTMAPLTNAKLLRVSAGATVERHARASLDGVAGEGSGASTYLDVDRPYTLGAVYGLVESTPLPWFRVSAGARLDAYSTFGASLNPRLALLFFPTQDDVVKVLAGRAFRAPSAYERAYNDGGVTQVAAPDLSPEVAYTGEVEYSHHFLGNWTALMAIHAADFRSAIITLGDSTPTSPLYYANSTVPVVTGGVDVEVRREWRQGWMFAAMYGYQAARSIDPPPGAGAHLINVPEHLASLKGVVPIVPRVALLASRLSVEGPRRYAPDSAQTTETAVVADTVLTGEATAYGLRYALGIYNLFDWHYSVPIVPGAITPTLVQSGRTLLLQLTLTL